MSLVDPGRGREEEPRFCPRRAPRVSLRPTTPMERKCVPAKNCTLTIPSSSLSCHPPHCSHHPEHWSALDFGVFFSVWAPATA